MSKFSKKQEAILNKGRELFWKHGIKRVSVEEICEKAGASKMTFYKYFDNKNDLVKAVMNRVMEESISRFGEVLEADTSYSEKAKKMMVLKMEGTENISKEFMTDYYSLNDPALLEFLHIKTNQLINSFMDSILIAQEKGEVRRKIKPEFIVYFFNQVQNMANDPELLSLYQSAQELIMELMNFFFYGILTNKEEYNDNLDN